MGLCLAYVGGNMDRKGKKDFVRTALIVVIFLGLALVLLDAVIGNSIQPPTR